MNTLNCLEASILANLYYSEEAVSLEDLQLEFACGDLPSCAYHPSTIHTCDGLFEGSGGKNYKIPVTTMTTRVSQTLRALVAKGFLSQQNGKFRVASKVDRASIESMLRTKAEHCSRMRNYIVEEYDQFDLDEHKSPSTVSLPKAPATLQAFVPTQTIPQTPLKHRQLGETKCKKILEQFSESMLFTFADKDNAKRNFAPVYATVRDSEIYFLMNPLFDTEFGKEAALIFKRTEEQDRLLIVDDEDEWNSIFDEYYAELMRQGNDGTTSAEDGGNRKRVLIETYRVFENPFAKCRIDYTSLKMKKTAELITKLDTAFQKIHGQPVAIQRIKQLVVDSLMVMPEERPIVLFLIGPPGCGKSETAKILSQVLDAGMCRIDATEHTDQQMTESLLCGSTESFKNAHSGTSSRFAKEHRFGLYNIEEPEKARNMMFTNIFMGMLNDGKVWDNFTETAVNCRSNIFVFTSNCCESLWGDPSKQHAFSNTPISTVIKAMMDEKVDGKPAFSQAFISRVSGGIVCFNALSSHSQREIVSDEIDNEIQKMRDVYKIAVDVDTRRLSELIILHAGEAADLRTLKTLVARQLREIKLRCMEIARDLNDSGRLFEGINVRVSLDDATEDARRLLCCDTTARVLVTDREMFEGVHVDNIEYEMLDPKAKVPALRQIDDMDVSMAILNAKHENARQIHEAMIKLDLPTYVYSDNKVSLFDFIDRGCVDTAISNIPHWATEILRDVAYSEAISQARRFSKVIDFDIDYRYDPVQYTFDVVMHGLMVNSCKDVKHEGNFVDPQDIQDVMYDNIVGAQAAKDELCRAAHDVLHYKECRRKGISLPRGVLLMGPGSGKRTLVQAMANESGLPLMEIDAATSLEDFKSKFSIARQYAPTVVHITGCDSIADARAILPPFSNPILSYLLAELNVHAVQQNARPVLVVCSTDCDKHLLNSIFLQAFDKCISLPLPTVQEREQFLTSEIGKIPNSSVTERQIHSIAQRSVRWCLADMRRVIDNGARSYREHHGGNLGIDDEELLEAFESFLAGEKRESDGHMLFLTAIHEASHAVIGHVLGFPIQCASIVSRDRRAGFVQCGNEDVSIYSKGELLNRCVVLLAGRAAEIAFSPDDGMNSGVASDLEVATQICRNMVCLYGMDAEELFMHIDEKDGVAMAQAMPRIQKLLREQYWRACAMVEERRSLIEAVANRLLAQNVLVEEELLEIIEEYRQ